jgi:hypothetical protein
MFEMMHFPQAFAFWAETKSYIGSAGTWKTNTNECSQP